MNSPPLFKQLKEQEKQLRKDLIMDAAERVFAKTPFDRVQMREIAAEVGLSAGAIYTYFPDQETLFLETALRGARRVQALLDEQLATDAPDLKTAVHLYIDFALAHFEYLRICQHCMLYGKFTDDHSLEMVTTTSQALFERFDRFLEGRVKDGEVRLHTHLLFAALNGILFSFGRSPATAKNMAPDHIKTLADRLVALMGA